MKLNEGPSHHHLHQRGVHNVQDPIQLTSFVAMPLSFHKLNGKLRLKFSVVILLHSESRMERNSGVRHEAVPSHCLNYQMEIMSVLPPGPSY